MTKFALQSAHAFLILSLASGAWSSGVCGPHADPHSVTRELGPGDDLAAAVRDAAPGTTVLLRPGTYRIRSALQFRKPDVTLRSSTGKRADVVLDGNGGSPPLSRVRFTPELVQVRASGIVLADLTLRYARDHAVHAFPADSSGIDGFLMHNLRIHDTGEQLVKVNSSGTSPAGWVDRGILRCSVLEFTDNSVMRPEGAGYYTGGLDVHGGRDWVVRDNLFRNIQRRGRSMQYAVHFWSESVGTVVENNRFEDNYRAIGFGMKTRQSGPDRVHPDDSEGGAYRDHLGGAIRNNTIWNRRGIRLETGIALWNAPGAEVIRNTVWTGGDSYSSIECRFANTRCAVRDNLTSHRIRLRNGARGDLSGNRERVPASAFVDAASGDLRPASGAPPGLGADAREPGRE